ncbi:MAG: DUF4292 domain-containing protein [Lentimicrobiaceae bacterium]|nr:DUF4292 domain-containing protein [Lentimicrobiaceae bacterium]
MSRSGFWLIVALILIVALNACRSVKPVADVEVTEVAYAMVPQQMQENAFVFSGMTARYAATYTDTESRTTSFSGQIRMLQDSLIWVSVAPVLGIEVFRVMIRPDSVFILNRLEKSYTRESFDFIARMTGSPLDFPVLQALLLGNDFKGYDLSRFFASKEDTHYRLTTQMRRKSNLDEPDGRTTIPQQEIWLDPSSFRVLRMLVSDRSQAGYTLEAGYRSYMSMKGGLMPLGIDILVTGANSIGLSLDFSKVSMEDMPEFPFRVPDSYQVSP